MGLKKYSFLTVKCVCVCVLHCGLQAVKKWPTGPLASDLEGETVCVHDHMWDAITAVLCGEHSWPCRVCLLR